MWLVVCHLPTEISFPERIVSELLTQERECWEKYSRIFHNKNVQLIEYQAKLINCGQSQPRRWVKQEENLVIEIMR